MAKIKKIGYGTWYYYAVLVDGKIVDRYDTYEQAKHAYPLATL